MPMEPIKIFHVDAFAERPFEGNPAAVCPLSSWPPDETLQKIASENNLSETAFFVPRENGYHLRWFTPTREVDLCGHATLASAFVLFKHLGQGGDKIEFQSLSGNLSVTRSGDWLELDFPNRMPKPCAPPELLLLAFGLESGECWMRDDYILVLKSESAVQTASPKINLLQLIDLRGVIVTAPGAKHDFVSRFFAPRYGIPEDPVTGSAHTELAPYWAGKLGKNDLTARQISNRGGELLCKVRGDRVLISGKAVLFSEGRLALENG